MSSKTIQVLAISSIPSVITATMETESSRKSVRTSKHITRACMGCRQRKTKCDGARPQCASCRLQNQVCTMPQEIDKRKIASTERYARLERYTQSLESLIRSSGLQIPGQGPIQSMQPAGDPTRNVYESRPTAAPDDATPNPASNTDEALDQLSERFGSLQVAEDGQLRFFGATSNLHIAHVGPFPLINPHIRVVYGREREILRDAGVDHEVGDDLEEHLLRLYFCWENPNIPVVDANMYYHERRKYRRTGRPSHRYSEVLTNAMCAVGAALTTRLCHGLPESLVDFFASRAKALLDVELDSPALCTVQALVILSGVEALLTRDARGWLYSGMAMKLSTDLGLHLDAVPLDAEETYLRRIVFWGAFIHDRMWSFYVGRPESLDQKDITVNRPTATEVVRDDQTSWKPYIDDDQTIGIATLPALFGEVTQHTVTLCERMSEIRRVLYNDPRVDHRRIKSLYTSSRKMKTDLLSWLEELPKSLALDVTNSQAMTPPHVLQLHMQYYAILVIIERPFVFGMSRPFSGLTAADLEASRTASTDAATNIAKILGILRLQHGFPLMNIHTVHLIFTAALVHVHDLYLAPTADMRNADQGCLQICSESLYEIGRSYKNAFRALEIITRIKSDLGRRHQRDLKWPLIGTEASDASQMAKRIRVGTDSSTTLVEPGGSRSAGDSVRDTDPCGFDIMDGEALDISPITTFLGGEALFTEPWGWTPSPESMFRV